MKKISIVYNSSLSQVQGINKVNESFLVGKDILLKKGYELQGIYTPYEYVCEVDEFHSLRDKYSNKTGCINRIRYFLKRYVFSNIALLVYFRFYLTHLMPAKRVVKNISDKDLGDLVLFQDVFSANFFIKKNTVKSNQKLVVVLHTSDDPYNQIRLTYNEFKGTRFERKIIDLYDFVIRHVDSVIFVSKQPVELYTEKYGSKVSYVYNGIDDVCNLEKLNRRIDKKTNKIKFISVGSVTTRKGFDLLVDAINTLPESIKSRISLDIIGEGHLRDQLVRSNSNVNIVFHGLKSDVSKYLEISHCFILTSRDEGLPIAIIEAMRAKLPIIATNVGGIPEMIDNSSLIVNPDVDSIKNAIVYFMNTLDKYEDYSEMSRMTYEKKYSLKSMMEGYAHEFDKFW